MSRHKLIVLAGCLIIGAAALLSTRPASTARTTTYLSPAAIALSPDGKTVYVADQTAGCLEIADIAKGAVTDRISVREPMGVAISPDGKFAYVSSGALDTVSKIDTGSRKIVGTVAVGREPVGLTVTGDGKTLYCCDRFSDDIAVIDTAKMTRGSRIRALREPRFSALAAGGKTLVVSNHLPLGSNYDDNLGAKVSLIDTATGQSTDVQLARGATDVGQVTCSPDGRYAYVPHVLARWLVPPTQIERGWISTNALTIIDVQEKKRVNTVLLDDLDRGAANPLAVAISKDGATLYVTMAGIHEVQIIDTAKLHKLVNEWPADAPSALEDDLTAVYRAGVRQRVSCGGIGPRSIVATDGGALVGNFFSGTVTRLQASDGKIMQTIALGKQPEMEPTRRGEMFFNDATVCFQGWQSCVSCHPDGRTDGLSWDLPNDGIGNPKNAKSMLLSGQTPPTMSHGVRANMQVAVVSGFKYILFHQPTDEEVSTTAAYIDSMKPVRSPYRNPDCTLSAAAQRGKAIFERADVGCAHCHPAPLFTNMKSYDVGTSGKFDNRADFDTPTLVEVFRTAPYLHDGSAVTMRDVFREHNKNDQHGNTSKLSEKELHDLLEYVLSL